MTTTGTERRHLGKPTNLEGQAPGVKAANGHDSGREIGENSRNCRELREDRCRLVLSRSPCGTSRQDRFIKQQVPSRDFLPCILLYYAAGLGSHGLRGRWVVEKHLQCRGQCYWRFRWNNSSVLPSLIESPRPGRSEAITGQPAAYASSTTKPNDSQLREGTTAPNAF